MGPVLASAALCQTVETAPTPSPPFLNLERGQDAACTALANVPWPTNSIARRAHLQRLESARPQCIRHAGLLAVLGAIWLEESEPNQALIWLERALLLDPDNLGAQADHALALAALGEYEALQALALVWRGRTDVPIALQQRLAQGTRRQSSDLLPQIQLGRTVGSEWASHRDATLMLGFETNLDHSPRLAEITLTPPEGQIDLPLLAPLRPRRGAAALTDLSWQVARSLSAGQIWRAGASLGARTAPNDRHTDWRHAQLATSVSQQQDRWRGQLEFSGTWIAGPLSEPYRLLRVSASADRTVLGCVLRGSLESETRAQDETTLANGRTLGSSWTSLCPVPGSTAWTWGAALRVSVDKPSHSTRPGGTQRLAGIGGRLAGKFGEGLRIEASLKLNRLRDDEGYSPLLESNARRNLQQSHWSVEITKALPNDFWSGAEAIAQVQGIKQASNLSVFRYTGVSMYSGIRWVW